MFLGVGNLINPAAVALLKSNAYQAAKIVLGAKTDEAVLMAAADAYSKFVIPKTNRALPVGQIVNDINFKHIAAKVKDAGKDDKLKTDLMDSGTSLIGSMPKIALVGGAAYGVYWLWKKHKKGKTTKRRTSRPALSTMVGV